MNADCHRQIGASSPSRYPRVATLLALLGVEAAFAIGACLPLPGPTTPIEPRYGAVVGVAGLCLALGLLAWARTRAPRLVCGALAVGCLAGVFLPRSSAFGPSVAGAVVLVGMPLLVGLGFRALWRGGGVSGRGGALVGAAMLGASWVTLALALGFSALVLLPARVLHTTWRPGAHPEHEVSFQSLDGLTLRGTYTPGSGRRAAVLVHGVVDGRSRMQPLADRFVAAGFHVLRIDQRAHGRSDGVVCTYGVREHGDILRAWTWLSSQPGVAPEDGVLVGSSMGGAGVLRAAGPASAVGVSRVVALAPASDLEALAAWHLRWLGPAGAWARAGADLRLRAVGVLPPWHDRSPAEAFAAEAGRVRLLLVHSDVDATVPFTVSTALAGRLG